MKHFILGLLLVISAMNANAELSLFGDKHKIHVHLSSVHYSEKYDYGNERVRYNNKNFGAGYIYHFDNNVGISAGYYKNSFYKDSYYIGGVYKVKNFRVGLAAISGYEISFQGDVAVLPIAQYKYKNLVFSFLGEAIGFGIEF